MIVRQEALMKRGVGDLQGLEVHNGIFTILLSVAI